MGRGGELGFVFVFFFSVKGKAEKNTLSCGCVTGNCCLHLTIAVESMRSTKLCKSYANFFFSRHFVSHLPEIRVALPR